MPHVSSAQSMSTSGTGIDLVAKAASTDADENNERNKSNNNIAATSTTTSIKRDDEKEKIDSFLNSYTADPSLIHQKDDLGRTPLHLSILQCDFPKSKALLLAGARADLQDVYGNNAVHNAVYHCSVPVLKLLLSFPSSGVNEALDMRTVVGDSPLDYACTAGHVEVVKVLLKAGANAAAHDTRGWAALHNAVCEERRQTVDIVEALLAAGADPRSRTSDGQAPMDLTEDAMIRTILTREINRRAADDDFLDGMMDGGLEF